MSQVGSDPRVIGDLLRLVLDDDVWLLLCESRGRGGTHLHLETPIAQLVVRQARSSKNWETLSLV